jgi:hypothetical protein
MISGIPTPGNFAIFNPDGSLSGSGSGGGGGAAVFSTLGVGVALPEQGALFEVRPAGTNTINALSGYVPTSIFSVADGGATQQISVCSTDYSRDLGDCLNIYTVGANGSVHFDAGFGSTGPNGLDIIMAPADGSFELDANVGVWNLTGATGATIQDTHNFGGTGVSTNNFVLLKAFPDPDGSGTSTSEMEVFSVSVNDATGNQTGTGLTMKTAGRDGMQHGGYRFGVNAIYASANSFTSNGFTLFDYANNENIFVASTTRPHAFQLGNNISPIFPHLSSVTGTRFLCVGTDGTVTSSASACSGT